MIYNVFCHISVDINSPRVWNNMQARLSGAAVLQYTMLPKIPCSQLILIIRGCFLAGPLNKFR